MFKRLLFLIVFSGMAAGGSLAFAATQLTVSPRVNHPTAEVTLAGTGFAANEDVAISFDSSSLTTAVADSSGGFSNVVANIPQGAQPGMHNINAIGESSGNVAQTQFNVLTSWAEHGFGPSESGANIFENTLSSDNVANLGFAWRKLYSPFSEPAVSVDGLYVGTSAGESAALSRVSAEIGHIDWTSPVGAGVAGMPAVDGTAVYVGSFDNRIFSFDAITGAQLWSSPTAASNVVMFASPIIFGGTVFSGSTNGSVYALDAKTGSVIWQFATASQFVASVAIAEGVLYVGSSTGNSSNPSTLVYALNASTGAEIWQFQASGELDSPAIVADHKVFFGIFGGSYYALQASDGSQIWSEFPETETVGSVFAEGVLYVGTPNTLSAINPVTGKAKWTRRLSGPLYAPVWANGVVYASNDKVLYAIDGSSGSRLLSLPYRGAIGGPLVVANGKVYIGGEGGLSALTIPAQRSRR